MDKGGTDRDGKGIVESLAENEGALGNLVERIARALDGYVSKREKHERQLEAARARFVRNVVLAAFAIIGGAIVVTAILTWQRVVSGEGFAFLVGTSVGSLITFLGERVVGFLYPAEEIVEG